MSRLQDAKDRLIEIKEELRELREAKSSVLLGAQKYTTIGGREIERADLAAMSKEIQYLQSEQREKEKTVAVLSGKSRMGRRVIFRDDL